MNSFRIGFIRFEQLELVEVIVCACVCVCVCTVCSVFYCCILLCVTETNKACSTERTHKTRNTQIQLSLKQYETYTITHVFNFFFASFI